MEGARKGDAMSMIRRTIPIAAACLFAGAAAHSQTTQETMKIKFTLNGTPVAAVLEDNATTRDFLALLPLKVKLEDYAATEKIAYLRSKLSTRGAPSATDPKAGDVTYYAPWGNLALFHKDFRRSPGLVKLGRIVEGFNALRVAGTSEVTIERVNAQ
ncbi:UNVERIFIED_ORG: hypothetical protein QE446_004913 [Rhizobium sp. SORGH_AS260]|uniref:cyclophilin-like fold protein n=1 Tax=Agrobacterium sp. SORGH_AS_0440 TaxID=3041757 RepID=UPI00117387B0|nr:cyclophilin-like fold protein [Agrobacterium sp. SORGH_AS_0440]MDP9734770.1 hypothetical protein [Rhizobium sp. SORGH_AS_0285]MDP9756989.1 hypothetical protein [Rhizobium sp. SORGH_AS_0260]MDR6083762.1 hypothetical protein [Agrobacterium sp. SORGH_AS_0440]